MFLYLINQRNSNFYKIGISKNPQERLMQLQTGSAKELVLINFWAIDNARNIEKRLHKMLFFHKAKIKGEWFILSPEYVDLIGELMIND